MKRIGMLFAVAALAATLLGGCVIVPWGWDGEGYHHHGGYPHGYYYGRR